MIKSSEYIAPNELTATEAIRAIDQGRLSGRDVVEACLIRIAEREADVQAWKHVDGAEIRKSFQDGEGRSRVAPLRGIPIGVKDVFDTADMPTGYGSPIYNGSKTMWDAACVALLRSGGATILGKTATTEFAMREPTQTRNPLNFGRSPGGSSSGSAAAVADFMVPIALGSQTTGSTIRPASYCGVYALKPSFGLINRSGLRPLSDSFDTVGIFSRSIEDLNLGMAIASGSGAASRQELERTQAPRIGFCRTPHWTLVDKFVQAQIEEVSTRLATRGAKVTDFDLPDEFSELDKSQDIIANFEIFLALSFERLSHYSLLSNTLKERLAKAANITHEQYKVSQAHLARCRRLFHVLMTNYDCILAPSAAGEAPSGLGSTGDPVFQKIWHGLHLPAVNIPALMGENDLPVGLQIIGGAWSDRMTLCHSEWIRRALEL